MAWRDSWVKLAESRDSPTATFSLKDAEPSIQVSMPEKVFERSIAFAAQNAALAPPGRLRNRNMNNQPGMLL